jgi:hypothetical protein
LVVEERKLARTGEASYICEVDVSVRLRDAGWLPGWDREGIGRDVVVAPRVIAGRDVDGGEQHVQCRPSCLII